MNRFKIVLKEKQFEDIWRNKESQLDDVPGFIDFNLIKGPVTKTLHCMPHIAGGI